MATSMGYIEFVCEQIRDMGRVRYRKMFGEYMVYVDDKPILLVCDNTTFVKKLDQVASIMSDTSCGFPYDGAKEHYILDIENSMLIERVVPILLDVISVPKPRKKKKV